MKPCVYTALFGGYEKLNEQPFAKKTDIPFICFTDDQELRSDTWQIRHVTPIFSMDPVRSQREVKLQPHRYLEKHDHSIYIDNSIILKAKPEDIISKYETNSGIHIFEHSFRETLLDEFLEVSRMGLDDQGKIYEQLNHYLIDYPELLQEKPYWGGFQLRNHGSIAVRRMLDVWYAHVLRYSRRDQLSVNIALKFAKLVPDVIYENNFESWFHSWGEFTARDRNRGAINPVTSLIPPYGRIRQLELEILESKKENANLTTNFAEHKSEIEAMEKSIYRWMVFPFRKIIKKYQEKKHR